MLMGRKILIMQHTPWQPPGFALMQVLAELGCSKRIVEVWRESAADFVDYDALILLGGDCSYDQEDRFPCLREEKRLVRAWINLNRPCLGFSLGCHLLAETAGATISAGHLPSVGIIDGHITHEGRKHPLLQGLRTPCKLFKWHRYALQSPLPRNMVLLATSKDCMVEACCLEGRPHIVGLQCDNYAGIPGDLGRWLQYGEGLLGSGQRGLVPVDELMAEARELAGAMESDFRLMMRNFVAMIT